VVHVAGMGEMGNTHTDFGGENERKRPFGRPCYRQENNITMDLEEKE